MTAAEFGEKAITLVVTAIGSGVAGYFIAALTLKKTLTEGIAIAKTAIEEALKAALKTHKEHFDGELHRLNVKIDDEIKEVKEEDLRSTKDSAAKAVHDAKSSLMTQLEHMQKDIETLERKTEGVVTHADFRRMNEEQTTRWEAVQRSIGFIEGYLKSGRKP